MLIYIKSKRFFSVICYVFLFINQTKHIDIYYFLYSIIEYNSICLIFSILIYLHLFSFKIVIKHCIYIYKEYKHPSHKIHSLSILFYTLYSLKNNHTCHFLTFRERKEEVCIGKSLR